MRQILKKYSGLIYVALITIVMLVLLLRSSELEQIWLTLGTLDLSHVLAAAGCIALYLLLRMTTLKFYLARHGHPITWMQAAGVTGAGQFYSAITPSASGGQPMQVLYLRRMGVPASLGTACVSVKFLGFQAAVLSLGGLSGLLNREMIAHQLYGFRWLVLLGCAVNSALIVVVLLTLPRWTVVDHLIRFFIRLGARLHIVRNENDVCASFQSALKDYREALVQLLHRPLDALVIYLLSLLQIIAYMSVAICLYKAFGLSGTNGTDILTLQLMLFLAAAFVPLPGAAGAQESGFCVFFRGIFPDGELVAAMICWRFFSYYLLLFLGLVMMALSQAASRWREGRRRVG